MSKLITGTYSSPDIPNKTFQVNCNDAKYLTTNGKTTGSSEYVLKAGQIDRDRPSGPRRLPDGQLTYLSQLRCNLTGIQDDINEFLTERMQIAKSKKTKLTDTKEEARINDEINHLLDGGDDDTEETDTV
ncbi:hypothetical protein TBLA_0J01170 [Henningerozyma blattae CBS 6284]|uniref:EKC/KEOPS complex subunit GON7 n=1 Tax=Henningerozyma blattae (strain ATCC 34711 / CBS 6284 / DSM 70876 / NBRC 10599 / NRRL Y-10934 / UCD 77-7) TaxID=1071380 RepID=I2H9R2_HENB6|nr:hypothetical protein TBLA_0J01170 [Tetrapisispora blattae CBS 6284]CCH63114.1 hypothetical protein TBLA_0J01170 [Tetrapisispora blattae CBS 6284]